MTGWVKQHTPAPVGLFRPRRTEDDSPFRRGLDVIRCQVQVDDRVPGPNRRLVAIHPLHHQNKTGRFNACTRLLGPQLAAPQQGDVEGRQLLRVGAIQRDRRNAYVAVASDVAKLLAGGADGKCRFPLLPRAAELREPASHVAAARGT